MYMTGMDLTVQSALSLTHHDYSHLQIYQDIFANFPDGIVTIDRHGHIIDYNHQFLHMLNYDESDLYRRQIDQFVAQDYRQEIKDYFDNVLTGHTINHYTKFLHQTGFELPVKVTSTPVIQNQHVIGFYTIVHDLIETERHLQEISDIKEKLISTQTVADIGSWEINVDTYGVYWSDQIYKIYDREEWKEEPLDLGKIYNMTHPDDHDQLKNAFDSALIHGTSFQMDYKIVTKQNDVRILHARADGIFDDNNKLTRLVGIVQDVTKLRDMEVSLEANQDRLQKIYDSLDMIVCSFNLDNKRLDYVSKGIERMINVKREHVYRDDFNWASFIHPADLKKFSLNRRRVLRGDKVKHDYRIISRNSQIKWVEEQAIPIFDENGKVTQVDGILVDFTDRKLYEQQMEFIANHDHLTGLKNRRNFEQFIQKLILNHKRQPFWIIYLDLDNFKSINDSLGHDIGDKVLVMSSTKIENIVEDRGISARLNGDEFIIAINKLHQGETIDDIASRLKESLQRKMMIDEYQLQVTSSIGISRYPDHGSSLNELLNNADRAVYFVKDTGKNAWQIYEYSVDQEVYNDFQLEQELNFTIENDQLELYLQPIIEGSHSNIRLAEALVRWKHPVHGYIPPNVFIPIAERSGFIHQIDHFVLQKTCETIQQWREKYNIKLSVTNNVSPKRFLRQSFKSNVVETLKHFQINANHIIFEITETTLIHDPDIVTKTIEEFRKIGIRFALDDFGTGYSSIAHLSLFNIDFLKIDRQFIQNIHENQRNQAILKGIINFTNELEIPIIAEGIETKHELEYLKQLNCHYFQGYYFAKPSNLTIFQKLLKQTFTV
ncbi:sensor domain-containing protein [Tenuibacillus multivorans]|nr:EAL domain-containing protein [Tenuibacillus multivorans]